MITLAAMLVLAGAGHVQPTAPAPQIQPAPDSPQARRALRSMVMCLADLRPGWARDTLEQPYLSQQQGAAAAAIMSGRDNCLSVHEAEMTFRTSTLVGSIAEYYIRQPTSAANFSRAAANLNRATPKNASEDFALCVATRDPAAARELALSDPGSRSEASSAQRLSAFIPDCTNPGERLTVDLQSLRALSAVAIYRAMQTETASRN